MKEYIINTPIKGNDAKPGDTIELKDKDAEQLLACGAVSDPEAIAAAQTDQETPVKQAAEGLKAASEEQAKKEAAEKAADNKAPSK